MLNEDIMGYMLANAHKKSMMREKTNVKADISEKEALEIYNEVLEVYKRHNVSYQCACRLTLALNEAFLTGAVELYQQEQENPYRD